MDLIKIFSKSRGSFQFTLLESISPILPHVVKAQQPVTRGITVSASLYNIRWRLENGYPKHWQDRGTLIDAPDFAYVDGRPSPYTSGQRARLLKQKEYTEKIIHLLDGIRFVKQRRIDEMEKKREETELTFTRKLKWKGVKEPVTIDETEPDHRKLTWKKRERVEKV